MGIYMEFCDEAKEEKAAGMNKIKLKSADDVIFEVDLYILQISKTLKLMLEDLGIEEVLEEGEIVPLGTINAATMTKVLEWIEHHKDDPPAPNDDDDDMDPTATISDWDKEFFNVDMKVLNELIVAASYLRINGILDVGCKTVSKIMKNKTPAEIRATAKANMNR